MSSESVNMLPNALRGLVMFQVSLSMRGGKKEVRGQPKNWTHLTQSVFTPGLGDNVGILTGATNGILVVDVDCKPGCPSGIPWFDRTFGGLDGVATLVTRTPNNGYHAYFKYDPAVGKIIHRKDMGIDILTDKACVFEGAGYTVARDDAIRQLTAQELSQVLALMQVTSTVNDASSACISHHPLPEPHATAQEQGTTPYTSAMVAHWDSLSERDYTRANKLFQHPEDTPWEIERVPRGWKAMPKCRKCLVDPCKEHSQELHSTLFINTEDGSVVKTCFACGSVCMNRTESKKVINVFNCILNVQLKDAEQTTYQRLVAELLRMAGEEKCLREKRTGVVYRPVRKYAYVRHMEPMDFINSLFLGDADFKSHPNNMDNLIKFMKQYEDPAFPFMVRDPDYIGFANGVLHRVTCEFMPEPPAAGTVCAKYFDMEFTGSTDTPLLDAVLDYQFPPDVRDFMYMCMGRMFGIRDNYGFMLYLMGEAGCGKSVLLNVLSACFERDRVGGINETFEEKFGLFNLYDKDIVVCDDLPKTISRVFPQQTFQTCVTGGKVAIAVKGGAGFTVDWRVPMLWAGNWFPDYIDKGQISRRVLVANYQKAVAQPDPTLEARIIAKELPAFMYKSLTYYRDFLASAGTTGIWGRCPEYFLDQQQELKMERNPLYKFLAENSQYSAGASVHLEEVRARFSAWLGTTVKSLDNGTFAQVHPGCEVHTVMTCKACGNAHRRGCCEDYARTGRTMRKIVRNMVLR